MLQGTLSDSWLSGVQRLRIPRPKMTVPVRHSAGHEPRELRLPLGARPADPPRDYNLSDVDEPTEVKLQPQSNCCKNINNNMNNNNQQATANFAWNSLTNKWKNDKFVNFVFGVISYSLHACRYYSGL